MSLISAAPELNDSSSTTSAGSTKESKFYRKDGKPLSKEAIYRAKQKYGVYQSPARSTGSGVADAKAASDAAANLANNNRTTIEAYKRLMVDSDASKAASAVSGRSRTSSVSSAVTVVSDKRSASAATKAYSAKPVEVQATPAKPAMDMSRVLSGAEAAAGKRMGVRMNPEKVVYVPSKESAKAAERSFSLTPDIMQKISTKNQLEAEAEREADPQHYASHAAYAVRDYNPSEITEKEFLEREKKKQAYFGTLTSPQVLALAKSNAQLRLDTIDKSAPGSLFRNAEFNKLAVALAQKSHAQRSELTGKINLGGGLWLNPSDVQNIAQGLITPVLDEVGSRALQQRAIDEDIKQRKIDFKEQNAAWIELQRNKIANDKMYSRETRLRHKRETDGLKTRTERKYEQLCTTKDAEVAEMENALQEAKNSFAALQREMEQALKDEETRCETELANLALEQKEGIDLARREQDEEIQPFIDDVKAAEAEHERLIAEHDSFTQAIAELRTSIENHKTRIQELDQQLIDSDATHKEDEEKLQNLSTEKNDFNTQIDTHYVLLTEKAKEQAQQSSEESRLRRLEVDAMINQRQSELNATELLLKNEKLVLLDAMRGVTHLKGEEKLDEDKVKALFGVTSEEFIAKQKESEKAVGGEEMTTTVSVKEENTAEPEATIKDPIVSEHESKPKKTVTSPDARPSMVDAVLPPDFKPEVKPKKQTPVSSPTKKSASAVQPDASKNGGVKRSGSLKQKLLGLVHKDATKPSTETSKPVAKPVGKPAGTAAVSEKKPQEDVKPKSNSTKAEGVAAGKVEEKSAVLKPETNSTELQSSTANTTAVSKNQEPSIKKDDALNLKSAKSEASAKDVDTLENSEDDLEDIPDSSEAGENGKLVDGDKKGSLFKEVF
ncbi:LAME_0H12332g1_1 [Lachancea meyersii CBS 8951]|uniref:LAME_0H12332g1_1 n=1 Tax=Lachancea meyersii CBS 8951 TaxID=1266667 RepID=A0A1G4KGN6_9SACH|nr:LAME_0H12332g1_1 [Lachancea meyersii CBS 8951]